MRARREKARPALVARKGWAVAAMLAAALALPVTASEEKPVETRRFIVYPESAATRSQAKWVAGLAERAFGRVTGDLGYVPTERIAILVYGQPEGFLEQGAPPQAVGTVSAPHNVIRIDLWAAQEDLYAVVAHETAHVVLARALRADVAKCPRWFNEGVATWVSRIWSPDDDAKAAELAPAGHAAAPDALNARFAAAREQDLRDAYLQSAAMVEALTRLAGPEVIARLLKVLPSVPDFDAALQRVVGLNQAQLYHRWLRMSGGRARWPRWPDVGADMASYILVTLLCIILGFRIWRQRRRWHQQRQEDEGLTPEEIERAREIESHYDSDHQELA